MSEGIIGNADLGTGGSSTEAPVAQEQQVVQQPETQPAVEPQEQMTEKEKGLLRDLQAAREETQRLKEYNEFIVNSNKYQQSHSQTPEQQFNPEPDAILYASEVDKLIEQKANALVDKKLAALDERRMQMDLQARANSYRQADANFDTRMRLATELVERDPMCQWMFDRAIDADAKIKVLEKIAKEHPLYNDSYAAQSRSVDEAMRKIQENANKPPTLSGIQTTGRTEKPVSQMNEQEYEEHFKSVVKKGY